MRHTVLSWTKRFGDACRGLLITFRFEPSFRLQLLLAFGVIALAIFFRVRLPEALLLLVCIMPVLVLEIVNSAFERLADAFKPRLHPVIRDAKDMLAGAVLLAALLACSGTVLIFFPHVFDLFLQGESRMIRP